MFLTEDNYYYQFFQNLGVQSKDYSVGWLMACYFIPYPKGGESCFVNLQISGIVDVKKTVLDNFSINIGLNTYEKPYPFVMGSTEKNHINEVHGKTPAFNINFMDFMKETHESAFKPYLNNNMYKFGKTSTNVQEFIKQSDLTLPLLWQAIIDKHDRINNVIGLKFVITALEDLQIKNNFTSLQNELNEKETILKKLKI